MLTHADVCGRMRTQGASLSLSHLWCPAANTSTTSLVACIASPSWASSSDQRTSEHSGDSDVEAEASNGSWLPAGSAIASGRQPSKDPPLASVTSTGQISTGNASEPSDKGDQQSRECATAVNTSRTTQIYCNIRGCNIRLKK